MAFTKAEDKTGAVEDLSSNPVRILAVVGGGAVSPLKSATWEEVMLHTVSRTSVDH